MTKNATPLRGTVKMVEHGTCTHCHKDILRTSSGAPWWHVDTGLNQCREGTK